MTSEPFNPATYGLSTNLLRFLEKTTLFDYHKLLQFWPNIDRDKPGFLYGWVDDKGRSNGREGRVVIKPGKLLKRINPELSDSQIESLVNSIKEEFFDVELTYHESDNPDDFVSVYTSETITKTSCSGEYKSLSTSCMRYKFDKLPYHPCYIYGSGDFLICYLKDSMGNIGARAILYKENNTYSPIYSASSSTGKRLESELKERGYKEADDGDWEGGKLLKKEISDDCYVAPYFDLSPRCCDDDGDYFVIAYGGNYDFDSQYGHTGDVVCCECCDETVPSGESFDLDYTTLCESCYDELSFICEYDGEVYHVREQTPVYNNGVEETWCSDNQETYSTYIESLNEYHNDNDILYDVNEEPFVKSQIESGDYIKYGDKYYCYSEMGEDSDSDYIPLTILQETHEEDSNGVWHERDDENEAA